HFTDRGFEVRGITWFDDGSGDLRATSPDGVAYALLATSSPDALALWVDSPCYQAPAGAGDPSRWVPRFPSADRTPDRWALGPPTQPRGGPARHPRCWDPACGRAAWAGTAPGRPATAPTPTGHPPCSHRRGCGTRARRRAPPPPGSPGGVCAPRCPPAARAPAGRRAAGTGRAACCSR